jgi:ribosomal protein S18 acetylase RimI-like enzyme
MEQTLILRQATAGDVPQMCGLLNRIIAVGGTTAYQVPFTEARFASEFLNPARCISCTVADDAGCVAGFQYLGRPTRDAYPTPETWAFIASFVAEGRQGRGIGQRLWAVTRNAARAAGVEAIDATIRADNAPGLRFYTGLGFTDWDVIRGKPLSDGRPVDRIRKVLRLD